MTLHAFYHRHYYGGGVDSFLRLIRGLAAAFFASCLFSARDRFITERVVKISVVVAFALTSVFHLEKSHANFPAPVTFGGQSSLAACIAEALAIGCTPFGLDFFSFTPSTQFASSLSDLS